jgi:hypothetical protein
VNIVERPIHAPGQCIATLTNEDPLGFIDTGLTPSVIEPRVYISVSWIGEMASKLGMVEGILLDDANRRIATLERELAESHHLVEAATDTLTHLKARKKKVPA